MIVSNDRIRVRVRQVELRGDCMGRALAVHREYCKAHVLAHQKARKTVGLVRGSDARCAPRLIADLRKKAGCGCLFDQVTQ